MKINHAIRYLRKKEGWTQQQLADFANTSKSNISNLENGNQGYSAAILQQLAIAFGCSVSQIFLLAENLSNSQESKQNWQEMPIEVLYMQLPDGMKRHFKLLMVEIISLNEVMPLSAEQKNRR